MRTYGGTKSDDGESVQQTADGGYVLTGSTFSFGVAKDHAFLTKANSTGDAIWTRTFGGTDRDEGISLVQTSDRGYVVLGNTCSLGPGGYEVMLTKLDSLGNACIGEFVSSTVMSMSCSVTSPATVVTLPPTVITSPPTTMRSCTTLVTVVCEEDVGVRDQTGDREKPSRFSLSQNCPNPFNQSTRIEFALATSAFVVLDIYDVLGRRVRTLVSQPLSPGYKSVLWDGTDDEGNDVTSGVYFYKLKADASVHSKKMLLLK